MGPPQQEFEVHSRASARGLGLRDRVYAVEFELSPGGSPDAATLFHLVLGGTMKLPALGPSELAALLVATSFAAGLNVYATVATLGLLARANVIALPPALELVSSWWVISASAAPYLIEFVADKIPAFDLVWNALQTYLRVPTAALL